IVLGETDVLDRVPGGLRGFLDQGGAALVATDRAVPSRLAEFGIKVSGTQVRMPPNQIFPRYRNLEECPILVPAFTASPALFGSPALGQAGPFGLLNVATNRPSFLDLLGHLPAGLATVARLPLGCEVEDPDGGRREILGMLRFGVGGTVGRGRL